MKTAVSILLISLFVFPACKSRSVEKYFTGTLSYSYSYTSDSLDADSLARLRPSKGFFRYDTINYQSRFTGADTFTYYYSGTWNKCIAQGDAPGKYSCEDYAIATDSVLAIKEYATEERVLGHSCRILELQKKNSWVRYFYATDLRIAPATYTRHKAYNWDIYGSKAGGGLILKMEHRFSKFTMRGVADGLVTGNNDFKALEIPEEIFSTTCK